MPQAQNYAASGKTMPQAARPCRKLQDHGAQGETMPQNEAHLAGWSPLAG
jgi:hypothetical protein